MYIDGHERENVVAYWCEFVERWKTYDKRFNKWDDDGHELPHLNGFPVPDGLPFWLVLVTYNKSMFYQNDRRKTAWTQKTSWPMPQPKGDGQLIMVLDFLTSEWGPLHNGNESIYHHLSSLPFIDLSSERLGLSSKMARIMTGISVLRNSLCKSIWLSTFSKACPKGNPRPFSFLIMHQVIKSKPQMQYRHGKCWKVQPFSFFTSFCLTSINTGPRKGWAHHLCGPHMWHSQFPNGNAQSFYFPDNHPSMPGWFKGMEKIIQKHSLWPAEGLAAQCQNFHCPPKRTDCCYWRLLFSQPDFTNHRSQLEELIKSCGHLCDFYPKYHCELNFIEQY